MKTEPTDIDREAGQLFVQAGGMRQWVIFRAIDAGGFWSIFDPSLGYAPRRPVAIDTDDPATVGAMLAQVEQLATLDDTMDRWPDVTGDDRWMLIATVHETQETMRHIFAPTLGALMVAAMKALKPGA